MNSCEETMRYLGSSWGKVLKRPPYLVLLGRLLDLLADFH